MGRELSSIRMSKDAIATTHGHTSKGSRSPEYKAYKAAKQRCQNPAKDKYAYYGGRGIKFLFNSFTEFYAELGPKPTPEHSIDRINNDGHYEVGNVRWSTRKEQRSNRRSNRAVFGHHSVTNDLLVETDNSVSH